MYIFVWGNVEPYSIYGMNSESPPFDCFFFIDMDIDCPEEMKCIEALCIECRNKQYPDVGWFYQGSELGYAEGAAWECKICKKVLNDVTQ